MNALKAPERSEEARTGPAATVSSRNQLFRRLADDPDVACLTAAPAPGDLVQEDDLVSLPASAQHYLRQAEVLGRPPDWSVALHSRGRFRLHQSWPALPCEAWQYNSALAVARVFWMR